MDQPATIDLSGNDVGQATLSTADDSVLNTKELVISYFLRFCFQVLFSLIIVAFGIAAIVYNNFSSESISIFLPQLTAIVGYWLPSPSTKKIYQYTNPTLNNSKKKI